jgi:hypothetical protein
MNLNCMCKYTLMFVSMAGVFSSAPLIVEYPLLAPKY